VADRARTACEVRRLTGAELLPLAQQNLDLSREAYKAGNESVLHVLDAHRYLLETRRREIRTRVNQASATVEIERTVGLPLKEILAQLASTQPATTQPVATEDGGRR